MKRITVIAGLASVAAMASVAWSASAAAAAICGESACAEVHDRWPGRPVVDNNLITRPSQTAGAGVPEPGVLPLLALGLGGVGFLALRRKRAKV